VRQAADLQEGPPDPARQSDTPLKVPFGFVESRRPELGDAKTDQRERAQFLAEPELRHVQSAGRLQLLRLLGDSPEIAALTGEVKPQDRQRDTEMVAPPRRHGRCPRCGEREIRRTRPAAVPEPQRRAARPSSALPGIAAAPISLFCTREAISLTGWERRHIGGSRAVCCGLL